MAFRAVLFDLDGTLVDERSSWEWVHVHYGVNNEENIRRYLAGELDDRQFIAADIALWQEAAGRPIHIDEIARVLEAAPLMRGAAAMVSAVRDAGIPTAIVSGGIDILAHRVAQRLGIDLVVANTLETDDEGHLTGGGICRVRLDDKRTPSIRMLAGLDAPPGAAVAVGNSRFDVGMFEAAGWGIAFAPLDEEVVAGADVTVREKDMRLLVPHLTDPRAPPKVRR